MIVKMLITIACAAVVFYYIYRNCILTSDDYRYMFSRFDGTLVTTFEGAWKSFVAEYLNWSGRLSHLWDILLLFSRGEVWRVATPILLASMPFLLFYFYYLRLPDSLPDYVKIAVCYGLMTTFSDLYTVQMLYWHTACVTYFYMPMLMIAFLIPFRKILSGKDVSIKPINIVLMMIVGFCLGMSQEVVGAITVAFILFTILYQLIQKRKVANFEWVLLLSSLIGFLLLILSPGNAIRQAMPTFTWWNEANLIGKIRHGLGQFIYNQYHAQVMIMSVLMFVLNVSLKGKNKMVSSLHWMISIVFLVFLLSFISLCNFVIA